MIEIALFLLKGVVVFGVAGFLAMVLRRRTAVLRDRLWTIAFIASLAVMLAPLLPSWSLPLELRPVAVNAGQSHVPVAIANAPDNLADATKRLTMPQRVNPSRNETAVSTGASQAMAASAAIWLLVAASLLLRIAAEFIQLLRVRSNAEAAGPAMHLLATHCARRLGITQVPRVLLSSEIPVPMVLGVFRSRSVLLPMAASGWSTRRLESVLLHELAHIRRGDPLITVIAAAAGALHWPNPLAWFALRQSVADREEACDMLVLATGADRFTYAQDLLDTARTIAGLASSRWSGLTVPHMAASSGMRQRISALLGDAPPIARLGRNASRASLVVALAAVLPIACAKVAAPPTASLADIARAGTAAVQLVDKALDERIRLRAAWLLGDQENRGGVDALLVGLADEDPALRGMSAWALGEIKDHAVLPALVAAMADNDPVAREMIIRAIGEIDDADAVPPLIAATKSGIDAHRAAAVRALGDLEWSYDARAAVQAALRDASPAVRHAAVLAIGESEYEDSVADDLIPLLSDEADDVRALAAHSLGLIGNPSAIDALIAASRDANADVRAWSVWALDEISMEDR